MQLAQDQDVQVREQVAGNPNTPWQILEQLAWEFPHAVLHNPVGPLQLLAHPEQISTNGAFRETLLREAAIPSLWWNWLKSHPTLSKSPTMWLHIQHAGETAHPFGMPQEDDEGTLLILVELLTAACTQGGSLPACTSKTLAGQVETGCEQLINVHLQWLAQSADQEVRRRVAKHPHVPVEILHRLAKDTDWRVREAVAVHLQTPVEVLPLLARDISAKVRGTVAAHIHTPEDVLHLLARDVSAKVREAVAAHAQTPEEALHLLARDAQPKVQKALVQRPRLSTEVLLLLVGDTQAKIRRAVADRPQLPTEVLLLLARDVRRKVARNERTSENVLRILAQDPDPEVRRLVIRHEQTPMELLHLFALDADPSVREAVAKHAQTPAETLQALALNGGSRECREVARRPQVPEEVRRMLEKVWQRLAVEPTGCATRYIYRMKWLQAALRCQWVCCDQAKFSRTHQQESNAKNSAVETPSGNIVALLQSRCATRGQ